MLTSLRKWLEEFVPSWEQARYLLAVSGGKDSVLLLHLFRELKLEVVVAHCNFQLRGEEALGDEQFVRDLALGFNLPFHSKRFATKEFASAQKMSTQEAARHLRYEWFEELSQELNLDWITVGTHKSDEAETLLINLIRGSGIYGLHGILPVRGKVIRPFIGASREEIDAESKNRGLNWREDSSNQSTQYLRNKIRHEIIPILKTINPNIEEKFHQNALNVQDYEQVLGAQFNSAKQDLLKRNSNGASIDKSKLKNYQPSYLYLHECIQEWGFSHHQCKDIISRMDQQPGAVYYSESYQLLNDRNTLLISKQVSKSDPISISTNLESIPELGIQLTSLSAQGYTLSSEPTIAALDQQKLEFPLLLRPWKEGDRFQPLGMSGMKKVSDYLVDIKMPRTEKSKVLVLESAGKIAWLIGLRLDERFKLTPETQVVYQLKLS